ncbi:MAG TPA: YsnF/AvaK domain-containing protein [Pyrinomonadaceae bacterium]|nr:YsnF/AvaK domain-containing protein [Pyrinomonadaceae bacterium]
MENTTNATNNKFIVTGLFKDKDSAECAYNALAKRGYDKDDTDVVMSSETRDRYYSGEAADDTELGSKALEGTGTGAAIGGTLGAIIAGIAAIGTSVLLPGIGLIVAGPLAAALVGAGAGGLAGGLIGALIGSGIPEEHAEAYESGIKSGGIVLRASPRNAEDAAFIESRWRECGGEQIYSNAGQTTTEASAAAMNTTQRSEANTGEVVIPVIEEELQIGKREVQTGGVRVETDVTERPVEKTVTLREEEINVERRPVDRAVDEADVAALKEGDFVVTEKAERAVVGKQARVVEEVVIGKDVTERDETVSDTVRRTDVEVEELSDEQPRDRSNTNR